MIFRLCKLPPEIQEAFLGFLFHKIKELFWGFRFLNYKKFSLGGFFLFLELRLKGAGFYFQKYMKMLEIFRSSCFGKKYKNFLGKRFEGFIPENRIFFNIRARKFHFLKYKEFSEDDFFFTWTGKCINWP